VSETPVASAVSEMQAREEPYQAFVIEQRGIAPVPEHDRHLSLPTLFWMWAGSIFNVEYVVTGVLVVFIGLSFIQAVIAILIGSLSFFLVGLASVQGPRTGTSTFAITRAPFGPRAGRGMSVFNWVTIVGYEIEGIALIGLAFIALLAKAGVSSSTALEVGAVLVAVALQAVLPLFGHATMVKIIKYMAYPFVVLFVIVAIVVAPKVHLGVINHGASLSTWTIGLALAVAGSGIGWVTEANDYSRYLPSATSVRKTVWTAALGGFIPGVLLAILGAALASATAKAADPISGLPTILPGWLVVPYLILAVGQLLAINTLNLYSSGLNLQSMGLRIKRPLAVIVDTVLCAVFGVVLVLSGSFNTALSNFLQIMIIWITPWAAIFLVDAGLRHSRYNVSSLFAAPGRGLYWGQGGFRRSALVAQVIGMAASAMWLDSTLFKGPFSSFTNGADMSVFMGLLFGGGIYYLLGRRAIARESKQVSVQEVPSA
jgi:nucleobase:cation symporter-1, NCS1 family